MYWLSDALVDRDARTLSLVGAAVGTLTALLGWYVLAR